MKNKPLLRLASGAFALLMLTTVFASCGKKEETTENEDEDIAKQVSGFTINFLTVEPWYSDTPGNLIYTEEANGDSMREAVYSRNSKLQGEYGLEVAQTYLENGDDIHQEVVKITAAQDDAYQCVQTSLGSASTYISENIYNNVYNIPHLKLDESYWKGDEMDDISIHGYSAGLISDITFTTYEALVLTMYNTPLANDFGIENLYDVTNAGGWTFDRMITEMEKVITDLNNDGQYGIDDRVGLLYCSNTNYCYFTTLGENFVKKDANGDFYYDTGVNERVELIGEKAAELIKPKGHTWDWLSMSSENAINVIISMIENKQALFQNMLISQVRRFYREIKTDFGLLPLPKYSEETEKYYNQSADDCISIPSSNTQLEKTGYALELMAEYSSEFPNVYFHVCLESKFTRDAESIDMIMLCYNNQIADPMFIYGFGSLSSAIDVVVKNGRSFGNVYANLADGVDEAIEEFNMIETN